MEDKLRISNKLKLKYTLEDNSFDTYELFQLSFEEISIMYRAIKELANDYYDLTFRFFTIEEIKSSIELQWILQFEILEYVYYENAPRNRISKFLSKTIKDGDTVEC